MSVQQWTVTCNLATGGKPKTQTVHGAVHKVIFKGILKTKDISYFLIYLTSKYIQGLKPGGRYAITVLGKSCRELNDNGAFNCIPSKRQRGLIFQTKLQLTFTGRILYAAA